MNTVTASDSVIDMTAVPRSTSIPRRGYDFNAGDRRSYSRLQAIRMAEERASKTGRRQVVRLDADYRGQTMYLVQEVGS